MWTGACLQTVVETNSLRSVTAQWPHVFLPENELLRLLVRIEYVSGVRGLGDLLPSCVACIASRRWLIAYATAVSGVGNNY